MILKLKRTPGIFLVGFMGCGKSTVGHALADELGWRFVDLDEEIEKQENCTIAHIFDTRGEPAFRLIETAMLRQLTRAIDMGRPHVVAVGGGAFLQDQNYELISTKGVSIWLDAPFERIQKRIEGQEHRPLARDPQKFQALYEARRTGYARAEYRIDVANDDKVHAVAQIQALGLL
jgi:shikimate kinase